MQESELAADFARIENLKRAIAFFERERRRFEAAPGSPEVDNRLSSNARVLAELKRTLDVYEQAFSSRTATKPPRPAGQRRARPNVLRSSDAGGDLHQATPPASASGA